MAVFLLLSHRQPAQRYWEIDALRGLAILLMISYHFVFDLVWLGYAQVTLTSGFWLVCARMSAILFLLLVGVALVLQHGCWAEQERLESCFKPYLVRGLKVLGWGVTITLVSWAVMGRPVILFGILHLIGVATMLAYPFLQHSLASAGVGVGLIVLGVLLNAQPADHLGWLWLGWRPAHFPQLDYFPLLPWLGVVLLGIAIGRWAYPRGVRRWYPAREPWKVLRPLVWLGQHSLLIYLTHQPVFLALLILFGLLRAEALRSIV
ncbi:MAG: heparan-alpha-glucosaminide N-acetyltransferase [Anaerolineae bacterium]|nr:heparan-alpha-glucosaminide N-acetyltransferase [Anaerolineae bacterium]